MSPRARFLLALAIIATLALAVLLLGRAVDPQPPSEPAPPALEGPHP